MINLTSLDEHLNGLTIDELKNIQKEIDIKLAWKTADANKVELSIKMDITCNQPKLTDYILESYHDDYKNSSYIDLEEDIYFILNDALNSCTHLKKFDFEVKNMKVEEKI